MLPSGLAVIALLLYAFDLSIMTWVQRRRTRLTDHLATAVKPLGDGRYTLPPLALLFVIGLIGKIGWATSIPLLCTVSFLLTGIVCQLLQILARRHRPENSPTAREWEGPSLRSSHRSFPSGHASASAAVLVVIGLSVPFLLPQVLVFALALLVALSRLNDHAHWPSDIFTGMVIGAGIAYLTVNLLAPSL
jgi:membrane-associated phospholipid phosphatase